MDGAPEGYQLSDREELGPLVRDFHEMLDRDLTDAELLALDFALEWGMSWAEAEQDKKLEPEYGVSYGMLPNIRLMNMPNLQTAVKVAGALAGTVRVRYNTKWVKYEN